MFCFILKNAGHVDTRRQYLSRSICIWYIIFVALSLHPFKNKKWWTASKKCLNSRDRILIFLCFWLDILWWCAQIELAKMLLEMGQSHLFEHWPEPGVDDDEKKGFFDQVFVILGLFDCTYFPWKMLIISMEWIFHRIAFPVFDIFWKSISMLSIEIFSR